MKKFYFLPSLITSFIAATCVANAGIIKTPEGDNIVPTGKGWGVHTHQPQNISVGKIPQNGIFYHGGPVMGTTDTTIPNVYFIWYGNWSGDTATDILPTLMAGIGQSPYYNINSTYQDKGGRAVKPIVNFPISPGFFDDYSQGTSLTDQSVFNIVNNAIVNQQLPSDSNGIYFVLTSADVNETSGFCTQYCGWHTHGSIQGKDIKYAFVGNAERCPNACSAQTISPNSNEGADAMASVIAHELEETVTDPNLNAWYDRSGRENADKCAWNFGPTKTDSNGSKYNMTIGGLNFLIQQNWLNANGGHCALNYP